MENKLPVQKPSNALDKLTGLIRERWPEYVIEIIVIILSISISFALDEWKDKSRKKELEQFYLKELTRDIESDINQLDEVIAESRNVVQKANALIKLGQGNAQPVDNQFFSDIRFIFKRPRFVAQDATFSDLKSTGNMQALSSFPLKSNLFDYYKQYESIVLIETAELESTNTLVAPYILKRLPLTDGSISAKKLNLTAIVHDIEFQNGLLVRLTTRQELLREYEQSRNLGKQILAAIKLQLK